MIFDTVPVKREKPRQAMSRKKVLGENNTEITAFCNSQFPSLKGSRHFGEHNSMLAIF
jgi:hypothetical protein